LRASEFAKLLAARDKSRRARAVEGAVGVGFLEVASSHSEALSRRAASSTAVANAALLAAARSQTTPILGPRDPCDACVLTAPNATIDRFPLADFAPVPKEKFEASLLLLKRLQAAGNTIIVRLRAEKRLQAFRKLRNGADLAAMPDAVLPPAFNEDGEVSALRGALEDVTRVVTSAVHHMPVSASSAAEWDVLEPFFSFEPPGSSSFVPPAALPAAIPVLPLTVGKGAAPCRPHYAHLWGL
jgi:hypothetical protein